MKYGPFSDRKQELYLDADPPANKSESFRRNNLERNEWMSKKPNQNRPPTKIPAIDIHHQPFTLATPSVLSSPISFSSPTENTQEEGEVPSTPIAALLRSSTLNVHGLHPLSTFHPVAKSRGSSLTGTSSPVIRTSDIVLTTHPFTHLPSLKKITNRNDGRIRLSEHDSPPAHEFLEVDHDEDNAHLNDSDDEPRVRKAAQEWRAKRLGGEDN